jgi:hypothetical protein
LICIRDEDVDVDADEVSGDWLMRLRKSDVDVDSVFG